jgi:hypothetical protein
MDQGRRRFRARAAARLDRARRAPAGDRGRDALCGRRPALTLTLADEKLIALLSHLPRFAREARLLGLTAIGAVVYFLALGAGLWLTRAMPAALVRRARRALKLAR